MTISILRKEIWKLQRLASIDTNLMRLIDNHPTSSIYTNRLPSLDEQHPASIMVWSILEDHLKVSFFVEPELENIIPKVCAYCPSHQIPFLR